MQETLAPSGAAKTGPEGRVITFGLSAEENQLVKDALPAKGYVLLEIGEPTDLIAIVASALVIRADALNAEARAMLFAFYTEIGSCTDETVFWLGEPEPPHPLQKVFKCCGSFEALAPDLKYLLLSAHRKSRQAQDYSKKIAYCIRILSMIRSRPYIRTQQIAEELELPVRTVQRYIAALQATGEWLAYDTVNKGWYLQEGVSLLFGDI